MPPNDTQTDYDAILAQVRKKSNERVDAYPFNAESFLNWARKQYPALTEREHKLIAGGIYRWFYGETLK